MKTLRLILALAALCVPALAQNHGFTVMCKPSTDSTTTTPGTTNIYYAPGACSASTVFGTPVTTTAPPNCSFTYTSPTFLAGQVYCVEAEANINGQLSVGEFLTAPGNNAATVTIPTAAPTSLTVQGQ